MSIKDKDMTGKTFTIDEELFEIKGASYIGTVTCRDRDGDLGTFKRFEIVAESVKPPTEIE